jgi:hypothetical protein
MRRGQILIKAPLLVIAFLGFAAFAVDVGFLHLRRATVQSAAESVALAAAYRASDSRQSSYGGFPAIETAAGDLAALNAPGCDAPVFEWGNWSTKTGFHQPSGSRIASAVRVTVTQNQAMFFSRVFQRTDTVVTGQAVVVWTPYGDVWPLAIRSNMPMASGLNFNFGPTPKNIKSVKDGDPIPGNKGWLAFNTDTNTVSVNTYLDGGPYDEVRPSPWVTSDALNQVTTEAYGLENGSLGAHIMIEGTPGLKAASEKIVEAQVSAGAVVLIPVFDSAILHGSHSEYRIVGLVPVQLVPPYTDLDDIRAKVLSQGVYWFPPTTNVADRFREWMQPSRDLVMVE